MLNDSVFSYLETHAFNMGQLFPYLDPVPLALNIQPEVVCSPAISKFGAWFSSDRELSSADVSRCNV